MRTFLVAMLVICLPLMVAASDLASPERCLAREASASGEAPTLVTGDWDLIPRGGRYCDDDTLWIFDADFNTTTGDDAGWLSEDLSGTLGQPNHWHKDTIRIAGFEHLGDSTWWCGAYDECWAQPRGYGNDWVQYLERDFPLSQWSAPGDEVSLEWDQRFAIEGDYDYGYVDISDDGGTSWTTLASYSNMNFAGQPGWPRPWDHPELGHPVHSLDAYAGQDVRVRFRFESDIVYSSQDEPDNVHHSVLDGAWQLDNIEWTVNETSVWLDDCESPGDNGWVHEDLEPVGQTGVVYSRVYDPDMLWSQCVGHTNHWWMMAVDPVSGRMVDDQDCRLLSPPLDVGAREGMIL
ncbi:immune inhibitor A, partial [bacterium]|nr:immune inhibitor A [bacterium]